MFWPTAVFFLYRWRRTWAVSAAIVIGIPVGLAVSQYWIARNPNHAYFLLPVPWLSIPDGRGLHLASAGQDPEQTTESSNRLVADC